MIQIRVRQRQDGLEVTAVGHAGRGPRGQDIVCAGVSALLYGFIAYLETLSPLATAEGGGEHPHLTCSEGDGVLRVTTRGLGGSDTLGWQVTEAGLRLIASAYPACVSLCDGGLNPITTQGGKGEHNE